MTIGTNPIISFPTDDHPSPGQTASHGAGRASSLPNSSLLSSGSLNWNYVHTTGTLGSLRELRQRQVVLRRVEHRSRSTNASFHAPHELPKPATCSAQQQPHLQIQTVQTCRTGEYELAANAHTTKTLSLSIPSPLCGWLSHLVPTTVHYKLNFWGKQAISALAPLHYSEVLDSIPSQCRRHKHFSKRLNSSSR